MSSEKVQIIKVAKRLDASNVSEFKQDALKSLEPENAKLVLNFSETSFLDSAGLGALVSILKSTSQDRNKKLALASLSVQVRQIFELTKLYRLFDIYNSTEEAKSELED